MPFLEEKPKAVCWRPKNALIECVMKTKCFKEMGEVEPCLAASECFHERKNWALCKANVMNPRYRLRGNPYDIGSDDQKKIEARNERISKRLAEEQGVGQESFKTGKPSSVVVDTANATNTNNTNNNKS